MTAFGDKLLYISPALGLFATAVGETTSALARVMRNLDATSERYGQYSPAVAQAQAVNDVRQVMGDMRRARQIESGLVSYLKVRGDLQQKIEDIKIRILQAILPAVVGLMKIVETGAEGIDGLIAIFSNLGDVLGTMSGHLGRVANNTQKDMDSELGKTPYEIIMQHRIDRPNYTQTGELIR